MLIQIPIDDIVNFLQTFKYTPIPSGINCDNFYPVVSPAEAIQDITVQLALTSFYLGKNTQANFVVNNTTADFHLANFFAFFHKILYVGKGCEYSIYNAVKTHNDPLQHYLSAIKAKEIHPLLADIWGKSDRNSEVDSNISTPFYFKFPNELSNIKLSDNLEKDTLLDFIHSFSKGIVLMLPVNMNLEVISSSQVLRYYASKMNIIVSAQKVSDDNFRCSAVFLSNKDI